MAMRAFYGVTNYRHPSRLAIRKMILTNKIEVETTPLECAQLMNVVGACEKIDGDIAEAGVFRGGSAALILQASPSKQLHLFDTFEGLPGSDGQFQAGDYRAGVEQVRAALGPWDRRLSFHPGLFPASALGLEGLHFAFVHLDLDLYASTIDALRWFWPRLNKGGMLLSHDYPFSDGVVQAFHEFFGSRSETFLPLSGNQCVAVKTD